MEEGGYSGRRVTFLCDARYQLPGYAPQTGHLAPTPSFRDGYVDDCMSGLMTCAFQGVKLVVEIALMSPIPRTAIASTTGVHPRPPVEADV